MFLNDGWTYVVLLRDKKGRRMGMCLIDLSSEDDRGDVEPCVDEFGDVHCTLGVEPTTDDPQNERLYISEAYEYWEDQPFNNKFPFFGPVKFVDFIRRYCDAGKFDGDSEEEIIKKKMHYGVLLEEEKK